MSTDTQKRLQSLSDEYQKLQTDLQTNVAALRKLEAQQQENTGVQREFAALPASANPSGAGQIYKLLGPVLLKQDKAEAELAVTARLEFIGKEIQRVEEKIKSVQTASDKARMEIYQLQGAMQQGEGGGGAAQTV